MAVRRVLFLCSRHRLRSPTAAAVFAGWPNLEVDSAGLADDAETPLDGEQVAWAELIIVMENAHRKRLRQRFGNRLAGKRVVSLDIPDDYGFMRAELVALLEQRAGPLLRRSP